MLSPGSSNMLMMEDFEFMDENIARALVTSLYK